MAPTVEEGSSSAAEGAGGIYAQGEEADLVTMASEDATKLDARANKGAAAPAIVLAAVKKGEPTMVGAGGVHAGRPRRSSTYRRVKDLSNVKEEVYGALDSFVAWELEFPLIAVKKALHTLEEEKEWKRIIQVFADMEELGVRPDRSIVKMLSVVFKKLDMLDKYEKLNRKYPPPKFEYRYIKGKRIRIAVYPDDRNEEMTQRNSDTDELEEAEGINRDNGLEEVASTGLDRNVLGDTACRDLEFM
ncbi:hypothetical protein ACQ4PT_033730 [Festuca glaucescens]